MATASSISGPLAFEEIYDIVKNNQKAQFDAVYRTLLIRSDYLSAIPENEGHSIFHYLVIHGALELFTKVIAIPNLRFNPLTKTATKPSRDILQISNENRNKSETYKQLYKTITNLEQLDKFVEHGKKNQIEECKGMLEQNEDLANQKPPYRKYYLIHHLAYANNKEAIDQLRQMCRLDLTLLTNDQKTASEVAVEQKHSRLAAYLESLAPEMRVIREQHEKERHAKTKVPTTQNDQLEKGIVKIGGNNLLGTFTCPITREIFRDPVVLSDGFTYERSAIQTHLDAGHRRSPMTNIQLTSIELVPNMVIKQALNEISAKAE